MRLVVIAWATLAGTAPAGCARPQPQTLPSNPPVATARIPAQPQIRTDSIETILLDSKIWGPDFRSALAYLASWQRAGEQEVLVFPSLLMGATPYTTAADVQKARDELGRAIHAPQPTVRAQFATMLAPVQLQPAPFRADTARFYEDQSLHTVWAPERTVQMHAPGLTIALVRSRLGPPEGVQRVMVGTGQEVRPTVLTLYSYAHGAVVFVESDFAPNPNIIDRVVLSVTPVIRALFEGER